MFFFLVVSNSRGKVKSRTPKLRLNGGKVQRCEQPNSALLYIFIRVYFFKNATPVCSLPANGAGRRATPSVERVWGWWWWWWPGWGANIIFLEVDEPQSPAHPQPLHPTRCL